MMTCNRVTRMELDNEVQCFFFRVMLMSCEKVLLASNKFKRMIGGLHAVILGARCSTS